MDANKFAPFRLSPVDRLRGRLTLSAQADIRHSLPGAISIAPYTYRTPRNSRAINQTWRKEQHYANRPSPPRYLGCGDAD